VEMLIEKDQDGNGTGVWVYGILGSGEKLPLREICWVFGEGAEEWYVESRPTYLPTVFCVALLWRSRDRGESLPSRCCGSPCLGCRVTDVVG
jgi:hypothetical protein